MKQCPRWLLLLLLAITLTLTSGLFAAGPATAASNGYVISLGTSPNNRPAIALSPDGSRACVAWATFDVNTDAFVRVYNVATGAWSPPLNEPALNVAQNPGEPTSTARCAIDAAGTVHVLWVEGANPAGTSRIQHRSVPANRDPGTIANWSPIANVSTESDEQWPDLAADFSSSTGRIWATYTVASGGGFEIVARSWTPAGWSGGTQVSRANGGNAQFSRVAVDNNGYVHVTYGQNNNGGLRYTYRNPASGAWSPDVQLPGSAGALAQNGLAVNRATGDVHVAYTLFYSDTNRVINYVKKTGPTGTAFSGPVQLASGGRYNVTRIAAATNGQVTVVADGGADGQALTAIVSSNNGASWGGPQVLTDSAVRAQWPWVAADNAGTAYVAYWNGTDNAIYFTTVGATSTPAPPAEAPAPTATARPTKAPAPAPPVQEEPTSAPAVTPTHPPLPHAPTATSGVPATNMPPSSTPAVTASLTAQPEIMVTRAAPTVAPSPTFVFPPTSTRPSQFIPTPTGPAVPGTLPRSGMGSDGSDGGEGGNGLLFAIASALGLAALAVGARYYRYSRRSDAN